MNVGPSKSLGMGRVRPLLHGNRCATRGQSGGPAAAAAARPPALAFALAAAISSLGLSFRSEGSGAMK